MSLFVLITIAFLVAAIISMIFTEKGRRAGHDDNGGLFYYLMAGLAGCAYTIQNVVLLMREVS